MNTMDEYKTILESGRYARFLHTNLHLHTPATAWDWNSVDEQTKKAEEISPEDYFAALNKTALDLVAITDHNTIAWCEPLMKLAKEGRQKGTSKIHILPGVEITSYEGPHIIGIFNEDFSILEKIQALLIRLGISAKGEIDDRVSRNGKKEYTLIDVIEEIEGLDGIVIAPHVHSSSDGIWGNKDFRGRHDVLTHPKLRILAAPSGHIKKVIETDRITRLLYINMPSELYRNSFAFINVSDCHRLDDFEVNTTWIKMGEPSLSGIRQIIFEPELRVSHEFKIQDKDVEFKETFHFKEPEKIAYPHILGMSITGGNLDGQLISFSPHQNSIIGKNYSGKSAILDFLRFGLDTLPQPSDDRYNNIIDRLCGILKERGAVSIYLIGNDEKTYRVDRVLTWSTERKIKYIDGKPEIFLLIDNEFKRETDLSLGNIIGIETYPQGEVVKIKDNAKEQIRIIDSIGKIQELLSLIEEKEIGDERTVLGKLLDNGEKIIQLKQTIDGIEDEIQGKANLEEEVAELQGVCNSGQVDELKAWSDISGKIDGHIHSLDNLRDISSNILEQSSIDDISVGDELNPIKMELNCLENQDSLPKDFEADADNLYNQTLTHYKREIQESLDLVDQSIHLLNDLNVARDKKYAVLLEGLKETNTSGRTEDVYSVILERLAQKQERLSYLNTRVSAIDEAKKDLAEEVTRRSDLLKEFQECLNQISGRRKDVVDLINRGSAENVQAELIENGDRTIFRTTLERIVDDLVSSENRIHDKARQLDLIVEKLLPTDLVNLIRKNDGNELVRASGISDNSARIVMAMSENEIQKLEVCPVYDKFQIKFKKEGDSDFTLIESGLSGGEQALALISVAMIPKRLPLVIDQPEDELGPSLITNELVEQIRNIKNQRQLIFVTHIANIPVLGDSEHIAYIKQIIEEDRKYSIVECCGSLENFKVIEKLLELDGGERAFQKRNERYSPIISSK